MRRAAFRRFKSLCAAVLLLLAPSAGVPAQQAASVQPPVPLLWKVSDADSSVYLLGSFHLLRPDDYPLSADAEAAFADAASLLFELSPQELNSPALPMQMAQAATRTDGRQLQDDFDAGTWQRLQDYALKNGLPLANFANYEPWFVGLSISLLELGKQGLDPKLGLDEHFMAEAAQAGKPVEGLETGAEQIAILDGMNPAEQKQFVAEALQEAEEGSKETAKLHDAWRNGDTTVLWNGMAVEMKREYPLLYRRINVARNDAWLPRLEKRLEESHASNTLVVVGALHLLGPDGVVEKLRAKGYKVERICSACEPNE